MSLQDVTFTKTADGKYEKAHYLGTEISALDLQGTVMRMQVFCSPRVWNKFERWVKIGGADGTEPNLEKGNRFFTILFYEKYIPNAEWEMDEDVPGEWDEAVEDLLDTLQ